MMLVESKLTADPAVVNELKQTGDIETEWATVTLSINNTAYDQKKFNLLGVMNYFMEAILDGLISPSEVAQKFVQLTEQGEATFSLLNPTGDATTDVLAQAIMQFGSLTEKGKAMTDSERAEAMSKFLAEQAIDAVGGAFDGLDVIEVEAEPTEVGD